MSFPQRLGLILMILASGNSSAAELSFASSVSFQLQELVKSSAYYLPKQIWNQLSWTIEVETQAQNSSFIWSDPKDWLGQAVRHQKLQLDSSLENKTAQEALPTLALAWSQLLAGFARVQDNPAFLKIMELYQADAQEPEEFFAQEFAQFIQESNYQCEKPALALWFNRRFGLTDYGDCPEQNSVISVSLISVPPGESFMESFGHIMFRVKLAPGSGAVMTETGSDNSNDLVISFYSDATSEMGLWDGFNGSAHVKAYVYSYQSQVEAYGSQGREKFIEYEFDPKKTDVALLGAILFETTHRQLPDWNHLLNNCTTNAFRMIQVATPQLWRKEKVQAQPRQLVYQLKTQKIINQKENL